MSFARTVLGDVDASLLGRTDYHEHLFQVSPLLPGDELDDEERSGAEAASLRESGFDAMIDATPIGLGRRPEAAARISASSGLRIVATTGLHREAHYPEGSWIRELDEQALADRFVSDIERGMPADDRAPWAAAAHHAGVVRAGLLKAGIGYWTISTFERRVLNAVAQAHRRTNAPLMIHLEHGSAAFEVVSLLAAEGVPADAVVLAHIDRNPDSGLHAELATIGAYLGYDGFARNRDWPDSLLIEIAARAASAGAGHRLLIGGDVARRTRYLAYGGMPGLQYLGRRVVPRLSDALGPDLLHQVLVENPARLLGRFETTRPASDEE